MRAKGQEGQQAAGNFGKKQAKKKLRKKVQFHFIPKKAQICNFEANRQQHSASAQHFFNIRQSF